MAPQRAGSTSRHTFMRRSGVEFGSPSKTGTLSSRYEKTGPSRVAMRSLRTASASLAKSMETCIEVVARIMRSACMPGSLEKYSSMKR